MATKMAYDELSDDKRDKLLSGLKAQNLVEHLKLSADQKKQITQTSTAKPKGILLLKMISLSNLREAMKKDPGHSKLLQFVPEPKKEGSEVQGRKRAYDKTREKGSGVHAYDMEDGKRGLCVIFAFFAVKAYNKVERDRKGLEKDLALTGYIKDVKDLKEKFESMGYEVPPPYENLDAQSFGINLSKTQKAIGNTTDRLVVIVLSHGDKFGISTCARRPDLTECGHYCEYDNNNVRVTFRYDDIMRHFLHDEVPQLKNLPKFFIFQCCRGTENMKTAGDDSGDDDVRIPVSADVLTAYATVEGCVSIVQQDATYPSGNSPTKQPDGNQPSTRSNGSWFIQSFLQALTEYTPDTHEVETILRRAHFHTSRKNAQKKDGDFWYQMSTHQSTLTRDFYLD